MQHAKSASLTRATDRKFIGSTTVVPLTVQTRGCMQDTCAAVSKCACQYMTCRMLPEKNLNHDCKKLSNENILCRHFVSIVERMFCRHVEHLRTLCRHYIRHPRPPTEI